MMRHPREGATGGRGLLLGVAVVAAAAAAALLFAVFGNREPALETAPLPKETQAVDQPPLENAPPVEADGLDEEVDFEIEEMDFEIEEMLEDALKPLERKFEKALREKEVLAQRQAKAEKLPMSPQKIAMGKTKEQHLSFIATRGRRLLDPDGNVLEYLEPLVLAQLQSEISDSYINVAELTPYETAPEEHMAYLQKALDHGLNAAKFKCHPLISACHAYDLAGVMQHCLIRERTEGLTVETSPVSWQTMLDWLEKADALWRTVNRSEIRGPYEQVFDWYPQASLRKRGVCLMEVGREAEALSLFDELKEKYGDDDSYTFHLKNYLDQPHTKKHYARYFGK